MNSTILLFLLGIVALSCAFTEVTMAKAGEKTEIKVSSVNIKAITRHLDSNKKQTWHLEGPNKGTWVDAEGKKIDSKNYSFKAPGTIVINKVSKKDAGTYDYIPLVAPPTPPPGVHVDPSYPAFRLVVN